MPVDPIASSGCIVQPRRPASPGMNEPAAARSGAGVLFPLSAATAASVVGSVMVTILGAAFLRFTHSCAVMPEMMPEEGVYVTGLAPATETMMGLLLVVLTCMTVLPICYAGKPA